MDCSQHVQIKSQDNTNHVKIALQHNQNHVYVIIFRAPPKMTAEIVTAEVPNNTTTRTSVTTEVRTFKFTSKINKFNT